MRLLLAATLVLLLAGCAAPKDDPADPLFGLCPQWTQGPGGQTTGLHLTPTDPVQERELGPAEATWENHALDLMRVRLTKANVTGHVELRGFDADDRQLAIRDYRDGDGGQLVPVVHLDGRDVGKEFDLLLSATTHGSTPGALPVHIGWTLDGQDALIDYDVTFHYKVCGADA